MNMAADFIEITDALYRFGAGVDANDRDLLLSALAADAALDFTRNKALWGLDFPLLEGRDTVVSALLSTVGKLDTTHVVTNPRVTVTGNAASLTAIIEAQHLPPGDHSRHCLMKNHYTCGLVREDDEWKLRRILVEGVWFTGDPKILIGQ